MSTSPGDITIRRAETYDDYRACQEAQRRAWGITEDGYVVPVATMVGAQLHGGLVLGAFLASGEAVGLSFAFLGRLEGRLCLYSQLTGVVPAYQSLGIGARLKRAQWEFAHGEGLASVVWAFDPLQAGNAYFNLARLGAVAVRYVDNMYGPRTDALNAGAPTDRLIVEWATQPRRPVELSDQAVDALPRIITAQRQADGRAVGSTVHPPTGAPCVLLEIPADIGQLRRQDAALADGWQLTVRRGFHALFDTGYRATGFVRRQDGGERRCYYILEREQP